MGNYKTKNMKIQKLKQLIKRIFKQPIKKYYFGKIQYGCPYFYPINFVSTIIYIRKLKLNSEANLKDAIPIVKKALKYNNLPLIRRSKYWIIKLFKNHYYIEIGFPIAIKTVNLGWKDKWNSPRFEWNPQFHIYFFGLQFCYWWKSPINDEDRYWEQILWFLEYSNKDIKKAEETWGWVDGITKLSTWNKDCLI